MENKLENPKRVEELDPSGTLKRIGLKESDVFCDIGAGTGIFTFAAAELTKASVHAVEVSDEMLGILQSKKSERNADHIILEKNIRNVSSSSCRIVLLCTVLHELEDMQDMMNEIKRILHPGGLLAVIEFHKRQTPIGPPVDGRLSPIQVEAMLRQYGFNKTDDFELGENFYALLFLV